MEAAIIQIKIIAVIIEVLAAIIKMVAAIIVFYRSIRSYKKTYSYLENVLFISTTLFFPVIVFTLIFSFSLTLAVSTYLQYLYKYTIDYQNIRATYNITNFVYIKKLKSFLCIFFIWFNLTVYTGVYSADYIACWAEVNPLLKCRCIHRSRTMIQHFKIIVSPIYCSVFVYTILKEYQGRLCLLYRLYDKSSCY